MHIQGSKLIFYKNNPAGSLLSWLFPLFYLANLYRMTGHSSLPYTVGLIFVGAIGLLILLLNRVPRKDILYIIIVIFLITGVLNLLLVRNSDYRELLSDTLYMGMVILMIMYPMTYKQSFIFFYVYIATFLIGYIMGTGTHYFLTSSGNYISVLIILAASIYYMTIQLSDHRFTAIDILPALLCFLISIWAKGRGGILSCLILLALVTIYNSLNFAGKGAKRFLLLACFLVVVGGYFLIGNVSFLDAFLNLGKWRYRGFDTTSRQVLWSAYNEKVQENFLHIFIGAPLNQISLIHSLNNNTHNSFLQLHATNGLIAFVLLIALLIKAFIYFLKNKRTLFAIVLLVVFVRGMTDKFIFGQYGMPILMYLILYPYFDRYISERRLNNPAGTKSTM